MNLKVGDTIRLEHKKDQDVLLRVVNKLIFKAQLGKVDEKIAVTLGDCLEDNK